jgi:hypothetical protein
VVEYAIKFHKEDVTIQRLYALAENDAFHTSDFSFFLKELGVVLLGHIIAIITYAKKVHL